MKLLTVFVTCASQKEAEKIAQAMVKERLAACGNVFPLHSVFRWEGRMQKKREWGLLLKTHQDIYPALERRIKSLHSYQMPAIVAWADERADASYARWVSQTCRKL